MIRAARPDDADTLYEICVRTGADGADATALLGLPRLLGDIYVGPYLAFEPDLALVLADADGVAGYVLGAAATRAFERRCEEEWWPRLRAAYPEGAGPGTSYDRRLLAHVHHPPAAPDDVARGFPAHLHVDLLPRAQGSGHGRALLEALFARLVGRGVPGIHLGVSRTNPGAVGFYRAMGFAEVAGDESGLLMARPLPAGQHRNGEV